ncbi:hypothetical protein TcWFU_004420 [Taenia crassiceps]|uniref:Uncharacterized protein n=1 Tax=Taenia crassiceps TaxID=6207 RepID=A0ABR4QQH5_9CEST
MRLLNLTQTASAPTIVATTYPFRFQSTALRQVPFTLLCAAPFLAAGWSTNIQAAFISPCFHILVNRQQTTDLLMLKQQIDMDRSGVPEVRQISLFSTSLKLCPFGTMFSTMVVLKQVNRWHQNRALLSRELTL